MRALDEDAIICDFAQYYHVHNYRALAPQYASTLACGLPSDSRIKRKLSGIQFGIDTLLRAAILDGVKMLCWMQSKDAQKGRNRPASVYELLRSGGGIKEQEHLAFASGSDFENCRKKILEEMV